MAGSGPGYPAFRQVVLDCSSARALAEFYRELLGLVYRAGDEPPEPGSPDPLGQDWLVLTEPGGRRLLAFQQVDELARPTWPGGSVPQQLHLDLTVRTRTDLDLQGDRAVLLGARLLEDRADDAEEPLRVYADLDGHPFCIFLDQSS